MADFLVSNNSSLDAFYDSGHTITIPQKVSNTVYAASTESEPTIAKSEDKTIWADGDLTYTIVFENESDGLSLYSAVVSDTIDANVTYNNDAAVTSSLSTVHDVTIALAAGVLTITFNDVIAPEEVITITFSVSK